MADLGVFTTPRNPLRSETLAVGAGAASLTPGVYNGTAVPRGWADVGSKATRARCAVITNVGGFGIFYTTDGTVPGATTPGLAIGGQLFLPTYSQIAAFQFIETAGAGSIVVNYYGSSSNNG